jgi:hypothetical protein
MYEYLEASPVNIGLQDSHGQDHGEGTLLGKVYVRHGQHSGLIAYVLRCACTKHEIRVFSITQYDPDFDEWLSEKFGRYDWIEGYPLDKFVYRAQWRGSKN